MSAHSEQSQRLARTLAEKAARNLRRSGRTVTQNALGQYVVGPRGGSSTIVSHDGRTINVTHINDATARNPRSSSD